MDQVAHLERAIANLRAIQQDRNTGPALRGDLAQTIDLIDGVARRLTGAQREARVWPAVSLAHIQPGAK